MRNVTLAVVLLVMNALPSAQAADLIAPPLETHVAVGLGDICPVPPWHRGWSRLAPFVCNEYSWWPAYYYYGLRAGMGSHHHYRWGPSPASLVVYAAPC
jgi:hypothetical protein